MFIGGMFIFILSLYFSSAAWSVHRGCVYLCSSLSFSLFFLSSMECTSGMCLSLFIFILSPSFSSAARIVHRECVYLCSSLSFSRFFLSSTECSSGVCLSLFIFIILFIFPQQHGVFIGGVFIPSKVVDELGEERGAEDNLKSSLQKGDKKKNFKRGQGSIMTDGSFSRAKS